MTTFKKMILGTALLALPTSAYAAGGIDFKAPLAYPEGVAYNEKTGDFFVSSIRKGTIGTFKADGKYREFAKDPLLVSSVGLHADPERGRLLACVSDPGVSLKTSPKTQRKLARLLAFDLKTGKRLKAVELQSLAEGDHFCNDLAVDGAGNVYLTDSFGPNVYKVDADYKASLFLKNAVFTGTGFNLNGIVHHKDGFLILGKSSDGTLWKVSEKDPTQVAAIELSEKLPNVDGLILMDAGDLLAIQNENHRVSRVKSTDGWKTAKVEKSVMTEPNFPTTGVQVGAKVYVLLSRLNELFGNPKTAKADTFTLTEVSF
jgi:sugar lactone lactonase YvrE